MGPTPGHSGYSGAGSGNSYTYGHLRAPAKSKTAFYATSAHWSDVTPIPLLDQGPPDQNPALGGTDPGKALATIAYSPRYLEAMGYVRALMADGERSERCLALSEDVIGMSPSHYTIWVWRMQCLRWLWGVDRDDDTEEEEDGSAREVVEVDEDASPSASSPKLSKEERIRQGVERELSWLEGTSERNLKNYQIWHHRQSLLTTYPRSLITAGFLHEREIPFVTHILSFDAKNYHVWTYRQWLCRQFPEYLLPPSPGVAPDQGSDSEIESVGLLIDQDVRNNSAWAHRYFVVFGFDELAAMQANPGLTRLGLFADIQATAAGSGSGGGRAVLPAADPAIVQREIAYAKDKVDLAPQNASAWNYLRGVLRRAGRPLRDERAWCEGFVRPPPQHPDTNDDSADDDEINFLADSVRSSHAIDWLADIYADTGRRDRARACLDSLAAKWDPIRRNYWQYRRKLMDEQ